MNWLGSIVSGGPEREGSSNWRVLAQQISSLKFFVIKL